MAESEAKARIRQGGSGSHLMRRSVHRRETFEYLTSYRSLTQTDRQTVSQAERDREKDVRTYSPAHISFTRHRGVPTSSRLDATIPFVVADFLGPHREFRLCSAPLVSLLAERAMAKGAAPASARPPRRESVRAEAERLLARTPASRRGRRILAAREPQVSHCMHVCMCMCACVLLCIHACSCEC
jgi:hypothetical protein